MNEKLQLAKLLSSKHFAKRAHMNVIISNYDSFQGKENFLDSLTHDPFPQRRKTRGRHPLTGHQITIDRV